MRPTSALPIFLLLASLSTNVLAQRSSTANDDAAPPALSTAAPPASTNKPAGTTQPASQTQADDSKTTQAADDKETTQPADDNKTTNTPARTTNVVITGAASSGTDGAAPDLTTAVTISNKPVTTGDDGDAPPPKYTPPANGNYRVPEYPAASVPNTKNAPYMQRSDLPEGTVFIAVGGALGLFALIAFAWRMVVAWQLRRSIRRANNSAMTDSKAGLLGRYTAPPATKKSFYSAGAGSSLSLDHLGTSRTGLGPTPNASLFFSPTANTGSPVHQNRGSAYLPAGYYAPASPGMGFNQSRDSLPRPRPATRDSPALGTPPASPLLIPTARRNSPGHQHGASISSRTSMGVQPGGRTPSTYFEDMLDVPFSGDDNTAGMTEQQAKRSSRRKSGHSGGYSGSYNGNGSRR